MDNFPCDAGAKKQQVMTFGRAPLHFASLHEDLNDVSSISTASGRGIVVGVKEYFNQVSNISWASGLDTGVAEDGEGDFDIIRARFAPILVLINFFRDNSLELFLGLSSVNFQSSRCTGSVLSCG